MLMVRTDPVMPMAYLQDRLSQDSIAPRRAKAFTAQDFSNVEIREALRAMTTDPDDLDLNPIRSHPLDHHACNQAAQQRLALRVTELRARPQIGGSCTSIVR